MKIDRLTRAAALALALAPLTAACSLFGHKAPKVETPPANAAYLNPALPVEARVDDLISRMTLEEKVTQLTNRAKAIPRLGVPAYNCGRGAATASRATARRPSSRSRSGWRRASIRRSSTRWRR